MHTCEFVQGNDETTCSTAVTLLSPAVGGGPASLAHSQSMPALLELSAGRYGKQRFLLKIKPGFCLDTKVSLKEQMDAAVSEQAHKTAGVPGDS